MATLADLFNQIQQQTTAQYGGASWWPAYQQAWSGGKEALAQWMTNEAPKYADWTPDAAAFASKELAMQQEHTRNLAGVNVEQSTADKIGHVAGIGGKIGAAMGVAGAAYLGAGALGAGAAGAEGGLAGEAGATTLAGGAAADTLGGEAALGGGLSTGATAGGIGGGETGTGLTAGATSGGIGSGAGAATGAGLGTFAGETAYPVFGGATGAVTGAVGGAGGLGTLTGAAAGGTALSRIMSGNGGAADWLSIAGAIAPSALGAYASNQQAKSLSDLADKYMAVGAPSRARYEASYAPGFTMSQDPGYQDALDQTTKATLHGLSVNGNPAGSPNAWEKTLQDVNQKFAYPALQGYRNQNAATGGYGAFSTAAPGVATGAIGAERGIYDSLGAGAANILNPPQTLSDLLHAIKSAGY